MNYLHRSLPYPGSHDLRSVRQKWGHWGHRPQAALVLRGTKYNTRKNQPIKKCQMQLNLHTPRPIVYLLNTQTRTPEETLVPARTLRGSYPLYDGSLCLSWPVVT